MKNKIIVLFFILILSCQKISTLEENNSYEKIGFAEFSKDNNVMHRSISLNSQIRITNLINQKNIIGQQLNILED